jgi:hypothetical protein
LAAMLCPDNPYDGHTLQTTLAAAERNSGVRPTAAFVDKGRNVSMGLRQLRYEISVAR